MHERLITESNQYLAIDRNLHKKRLNSDRLIMYYNESYYIVVVLKYTIVFITKNYIQIPLGIYKTKNMVFIE